MDGFEAVAAMPRVDAILANPVFRQALTAIEQAERDRRFCRHGLEHLLGVARAAQLVNAERGLGIDREVVYAAALLHDIGRAEQYAGGEDHDRAGARIADEILASVDESARFTPAERASIVDAIAGHRGDGPGEGADVLARLLAWADHATRPCFACDAADACYWPDEKKNLRIKI